MNEPTCLYCDGPITPSRSGPKKKYCTTKHRKAAENQRAKRRTEGTPDPEVADTARALEAWMRYMRTSAARQRRREGTVT